LQLRAAEEQIILRSRAVEMQWSSDKCQQSVKGMCSFFSCFRFSISLFHDCAVCSAGYIDWADVEIVSINSTDSNQSSVHWM